MRQTSRGQSKNYVYLPAPPPSRSLASLLGITVWPERPWQPPVPGTALLLAGGLPIRCCVCDQRCRGCPSSEITIWATMIRMRHAQIRCRCVASLSCACKSDGESKCRWLQSLEPAPACSLSSVGVLLSCCLLQNLTPELQAPLATVNGQKYGCQQFNKDKYLGCTPEDRLRSCYSLFLCFHRADILGTQAGLTTPTCTGVLVDRKRVRKDGRPRSKWRLDA